ncbi:hypothetical protein DIPPA_16383 [Diplonema papillatum]|nr:hypothetical protein DIPPA_16383 [Diplonema papillatum]
MATHYFAESVVRVNNPKLDANITFLRVENCDSSVETIFLNSVGIAVGEFDVRNCTSSLAILRAAWEFPAIDRLRMTGCHSDDRLWRASLIADVATIENCSATNESFRVSRVTPSAQCGTSRPTSIAGDRWAP